jgi:hypothetical protein
MLWLWLAAAADTLLPILFLDPTGSLGGRGDEWSTVVVVRSPEKERGRVEDEDEEEASLVKYDDVSWIP